MSDRLALANAIEDGGIERAKADEHWSQAGAEFRAHLDEEARRYREEREPAKPTHPQRPSASDYSHEDYKAGKFWVFDDRLQLSEDDKHHIPVCIDHQILDGGETTVTFEYLGVIDALDLTAVRKTSASADFVLIRKATRAEVAATSGIVRQRRRRKKRDPRRDIRRRLAEVERALGHLTPSPGIGHNQMPLDSALHREGIEAVRQLAEEAQAEQPSPAKIMAQAGVLKRVSAALAAYVLPFRDGVLKGTGGFVAGLFAPKLLTYAEQALAQLRLALDAIAQWIAALPPGGPAS